MKFMKQLVALTAAMAICSTTVSTSVSAKSFYSVHEGYYNENLTEEIVTEEEISVEETIPAEEEAVPADEIPEETVPEDVVPEEAPQDEPAAPAQEETTIVEESNGMNTITVIDNGYAKIPAALVYSKQVQLKDNSLEVVWGAVVSLAIIPNSPYESSKITVTVTDDNGRIVNVTYKKGYITDSTSEQYVDMYMVFVQSNLTVELTYRDEIPVTILPCEHGTITYEIDSSKLGSPNILFTAHPDEGYGTRNIVIHDAKGQLVGSAKFPYSIAQVNCLGNTSYTVEAEFSPTYSLTGVADEHAKISFNVGNKAIEEAIEGIYVKPIIETDDGYGVNELTVTDADGNTLQLNKDEGWLEMPASDLTVTVTSNKWESYVDENGVEYPISAYHLLDEMEDNDNLCLEDGWYLASKSVTFHNRARIEGDVNLILIDGTTLKMEQGIRVGNQYGDGTNSLTIWGQKDGTGKLHCISNEIELAAIGGNDKENNGVINIHSGVVVAESDGWAAAIGGGNKGSRGTINIYGGQVNAKNVGSGGAGIGCGLDACGNGQINIYGGSIDAGGYGSAIGGGYSSEGGSITIKGGNISAVNIAPPGWFVRGGAGIGSGPFGKEQSIYISGGTIYAEALWVEHARAAHYYSEPIGAGMLGTVDSLIITSNMREIERTKHTVRLTDQP